MKKTIIILASILAFLCQNIVCSNAEHISNNVIDNKVISSEEITIGQIEPKAVDNSNLLVEVTMIPQNGDPSVIYTGTLGGYVGEMLNDIDFSEINVLIIFDWENSDTLYIKPIEELSSEEFSTDHTYNTSLMNTNENMMSISSGLSIESQIKINGVNVGENGLRIIDNATLSCTFNISNESNAKKTLTPILVTYNENGRMQNVKIVEVDIAAEDMQSVQIIYQFDAENEYLGKLMMWDSITNMMPLRATVNFTQTSGVNAYYYDSNNRLLQVDKINGKSLIYTYDNMGNLLTKGLKTEEAENE